MVTPHGNIDLGHHWLRLWLIAWQHQVITWTIVDLSSVEFCGVHPRAASYEWFKQKNDVVSLKITLLKLLLYLLGDSEIYLFFKGLDTGSLVPFIKLNMAWSKDHCIKKNMAGSGNGLVKIVFYEQPEPKI